MRKALWIGAGVALCLAAGVMVAAAVVLSCAVGTDPVVSLDDIDAEQEAALLESVRTEWAA